MKTFNLDINRLKKCRDKSKSSLKYGADMRVVSEIRLEKALLVFRVIPNIGLCPPLQPLSHNRATVESRATAENKVVVESRVSLSNHIKDFDNSWRQRLAKARERVANRREAPLKSNANPFATDREPSLSEKSVDTRSQLNF